MSTGSTGDVHWFDSCDVEQGEVEDCPDVNGLCVETSATTAMCDCEVGWDFETGCTSCEGGYHGSECAELCAFRVDGSVDSSGDGLSWFAPFRTVQEGIDAAAAASDPTMDVVPYCEVWVLHGVYFIYETAATDTVQLQPRALLDGG